MRCKLLPTVFLAVFLSAVSCAAAQQPAPAPPGPAASLDDTANYIVRVLQDRDEVVHAEAGSSDPHAVHWEFESIAEVIFSTCTLDYSQSVDTIDVEGPNVSFTPEYTAAPPENTARSSANPKRFHLDFADVRTITVETLEHHLTQESAKSGDNKTYRVTPRIYALTLAAPEPVFTTEQRSRVRPPSLPPRIHVPGRSGGSDPYSPFIHTLADSVTYLFAEEASARAMASAMQHAVDLCRAEAQPVPASTPPPK